MPCIAIGLGLEVTPIGLAAAQQTRTLVDVEPCIDIESVLERLDCYDMLARAARAAQSSTDPARPSQPATDATPASATAARAAPSEPAPSNATESVSEVAALREIQPGRLEITLTNGEVWRQTRSDRYRLAVGHEVRIYASRFGQDYRLTAPALRGFVQVERVR